MLQDKDRYNRLMHITQLVNSKLDLQLVLENVVTAISEEIVRCNSVGIYLPQMDGTFRGNIGKPDNIRGVTLDQMVIDPKSDSLVKEIVETKKSIYIPDTSLDNRPDPRPIEMFQIKSLLGVPITFEDELFGLVFLFNSGRLLNLALTEIQSVEAYVNMAAVAIRNTNLFKQKQMVLDATSELSLCTSVEKTLNTCFRYLERSLHNSDIGIHLSDGYGSFYPMTLGKNSSWTEDDWKKTHSLLKVNFEEDLVFQDVVRTRKSVIITDVSKDPRPNHDACESFGIKSLYIIPLVAAGKVLGMVAIVSLGAIHKYTSSEIQLAESITNVTASVLSDLLRMGMLEQTVERRTNEIKQKNVALNNVIQQLKQLSHQHDLILNTVAEGIYGINVDRQITFCNRSAAQMIGCSLHEIIGKYEDEIFHYTTTNLHSALGLTLNDTDFNLRATTCDVLSRKDNTIFPVELTRTPIEENNQNMGHVVTFRDITSRKQMEIQIENQAYYDALTGLPNRFLFNEKLKLILETPIKPNQKIAVMFIDLDQFKMINDTLGHDNGDILLKQVARRLLNCVRRKDVVARLGGDEFTMILPIDSDEVANQVAERIITEIQKPFIIDNCEFYVKPSIGISMYPTDGDNAETLVKCADIAMYRSKEQGGNNFRFYTCAMNSLLEERVNLERHLHNALANDKFVLFYQPQVDLTTGQVCGMEALIRWVHPEKGLIPPAQFIPIAEETGLIVPIGDWVLRTACTQAKRWNRNVNSPIRLSVNISVRQFITKDFVSSVGRALSETGINPDYLELELTESIILQNTESVIATMHQLKELGVRISIDDFGTGYSSLGYLKDFPIDSLKIDQSFIHGLPMNKKNIAIISAIITLAQNLGLESVAEGVETEEQLLFLKAEGCKTAQGYYYSRPLPAAEMSNLLLNWNNVIA